jgi:hypothetical protein
MQIDIRTLRTWLVITLPSAAGERASCRIIATRQPHRLQIVAVRRLCESGEYD